MAMEYSFGDVGADGVAVYDEELVDLDEEGIDGEEGGSGGFLLCRFVGVIELFKEFVLFFSLAVRDGGYVAAFLKLQDLLQVEVVNILLDKGRVPFDLQDCHE